MSDRLVEPPPHRPAVPADAGRPAASSPAPTPTPASCADAMPCDRCGTPMFRMHAVWRCPGCGYKTDCCGW